MTVRRDEWPLAVLGWTGSTMFERTLRFYADRHGFNVTNHALHRRLPDGSCVRLPVACEEDVFAHLGLAYIPPEERDL